MAKLTRDGKALVVLILICCFAFWNRTSLWKGYTSFSEHRPEIRGPVGRLERMPPASVIPDLPKVELDTNHVRLNLAATNRALGEYESKIQISEIFYHASDGSEDAEFVELANFTGLTVSLAGWSFSEGVKFTFPPGAALDHGECLVVCQNETALRAAFGAEVKIAGTFQGGLKNSGELLRLENDRQETVLEQIFGDAEPWPSAADGSGSSLQIRGRGFDSNDPRSWIASTPSPGIALRDGADEMKFAIVEAWHEPLLPLPEDSVTISASITHSDPDLSAELHMEIDGSEYVFPVRSSPYESSISVENPNRQASRFSAFLPPLPHFTLVRYWFTARDAMGNAYRSPSEKLPVPFHAFFVEERDSAKTLPVYSLRLLGSDLAAMQANSWNNQTFPATLVVKQEVYDSVRIRVRGAFARSWPKKSFKILFEKGNLFGNRSRINLNSGWRDPAFIREILSYRIYRDSGAYSLNAEPVFVRVNGQFLGLFTAIEQPDKRYLDSQGISGAVLYKADSGNNVSDERNLGDANSFRQHYEKETDEEEPYDDLAEFCRDLEQTRKVKEFFEARVDLRRYVNFLCATTLCQNWDGYNKNHFIGVDRENSGKWFAIPWDLDRTLGDHWNGHFNETRLPLLLGIRDLPGVTGWNRMANRFFSDPHLRRLYKERLNELLESVFTEANLFPIVESLRQKISAAADMDHEKWRSAWSASRGVDEVKLFIRDRRVFLLGELERF